MCHWSLLKKRVPVYMRWQNFPFCHPSHRGCLSSCVPKDTKSLCYNKVELVIYTKKIEALQCFVLSPSNWWRCLMSCQTLLVMQCELKAGFYSLLSCFLKAINSHRPMMQQEMSKNFVLSNYVMAWFVLRPFFLSNSSCCSVFSHFVFKLSIQNIHVYYVVYS